MAKTFSPESIRGRFYNQQENTGTMTTHAAEKAEETSPSGSEAEPSQEGETEAAAGTEGSGSSGEGEGGEEGDLDFIMEGLGWQEPKKTDDGSGKEGDGQEGSGEDGGEGDGDGGEAKPAAKKAPTKKAATKTASTETEQTGKEGEGEEPETERLKREKEEAKTRRSEASHIDAKEIARETGKAVAETLQFGKDKETGQESTEDQFIEGLSEEDQEDYAAIKKLEEMDGRHKGKSKQFVDYVKKLEQYKERWEKENNSTFDPSDSEHEEFFKKHRPDVSERDLKKAQNEILKDQIYNERLQPEIQKVRRETAWKYAEPRIEESVNRSVLPFIEQVDEDLVKTLKEEGAEAAKEKDPIAIDVINREGKVLGDRIRELEKLMDPELGYEGNAENEHHLEIDKAASSLEQDILSDESKQKKNGRDFIPMAEYNQLSDAEKKRYWTLDTDMIRQEIIRQQASAAKEQIEPEREKFRKYAEKMGWVTDKSGQSGKEKESKPASKSTQSTSEEQTKAPAKKSSSKPPSTETEEQVSTSRNKTTPEDLNSENVVSTLFS